MFALVLWIAFAVGSLLLGCKGLFIGNIPWSKSTDITGVWARLIGLACLLIGIPASALVFQMAILVIDGP